MLRIGNDATSTALHGLVKVASTLHAFDSESDQEEDKKEVPESSGSSSVGDSGSTSGATSPQRCLSLSRSPTAPGPGGSGTYSGRNDTVHSSDGTVAKGTSLPLQAAPFRPGKWLKSPGLASTKGH